MQNRYSHITSNPNGTHLPSQSVSQRETRVKGKKEVSRIGRDAYDTLVGLLAEEPETPTTPLGVFVANSTKRNLLKQIESLFKP